MGPRYVRTCLWAGSFGLFLALILALSCRGPVPDLPLPSVIGGAELRFSPEAEGVSLIGWERSGSEAFERGGREGKPVILLLTALGSQGARRFDEGALSDSAVIERLNSAFVPARVDVERHPEVAGRFPGKPIPTTICLTPAGAVVDDAGILDGREMEAFLTRCLDRSAGIGGVGRERVSRPPPRELSDELVELVVVSLRRELGTPEERDAVPPPGAISLLLYLARTRGEEELADLACESLLSVRGKAFWDRVEGGVRGPTGKSLDMNAALAMSHLRAWAATGDPAHRRSAGEILGYLERVLFDEGAGVYRAGQLDDEAYYALDAAGRAKAAAAPPVDGTLYTDRNARMASLGLHAAILLDEAHRREEALALLENLWASSVGDDRRVSHLFDGDGRPAAVPNLVADVMYLAQALLDAYACTGQAQYLVRARELVDGAMETLWDETRGAFCDRPDAGWPPALGIAEEPPLHGNLVGALVLLRLGWCTEDPAYREPVRRLLSRWSGEYEQLGEEAGAYALALERYIDYPVRMMVIGPRDDERTRALLTESLRLYEPAKHVQLLDPEQEPEEVEARGFPAEMEPALFTCVGRACSPPVTEPDEVAASVSEFVEQMRRR